MRLFSGKTKLALINSKELVLDWSELLMYKGNLKGLESWDKLMGRSLFLISIVIAAVMFFTELFIGRNPFISLTTNLTLNSLIFWIGIFALCYGSYLLRDRNVFDHKIRNKDLSTIFTNGDKVNPEIFLNDYLDKELLIEFDRIYFKTDHNFMNKLIEITVKRGDVVALIKRLGLKEDFVNLVINKSYPEFEDDYSRLFFEAFKIALELNSKKVSFQHLFLFMISQEEYLRKELITLGITEGDIRGVQIWLRNQELRKKYLRLWEKQSVLKPKGTVNRAYTSVYSPTVEDYTEDYTLRASIGSFELATGREEDLNNLIVSLVNNRGSAVLLMAKPGVGKTKLLRNLAVRMVVEDVPEALKDMRLVAFDFQKTYSLIDSPDKLRTIVHKLFEEVSRSKNIILVFEDIDNLLTMRSSLGTEILNTLINAINKHQVRLIFTITEENYTKYIQPNPILASLFKSLRLKEPAPETLKQIILDSVYELEKKYKVSFQYDAVKAVVALSKKISYDTAMPKGALQIMEDLAIAGQVAGVYSIGSEFVSNHLSSKLGIKVGDVTVEESKKLLNIEEEMHKRVVGQELAINMVGNALRRTRAGLGVSSKPVASFLFYGPTGVGKTEVAKTLAATYFGDERAMIRLDMSEYHEQSNLVRLLGEESEGKFTGGMLTEPVRTNPFSLLLLDEIEKANSHVLDLFLHILDEGYVKDGLGREIDFTNTIIIATSNVASKLIAEKFSNNENYEAVYNATQQDLRQLFRIEFLNRFDGIIMFKPLDREEVRQIVRLRLDKIIRNLNNQGIEMKYSFSFVNYISQISYNSLWGAREINRIIQEKVENKLAHMIISGELVSGKSINFEEENSVSIV